MREAVSAVLCALILLSLVGCGASAPRSDAPSQPAEPSVTAETSDAEPSAPAKAPDAEPPAPPEAPDAELSTPEEIPEGMSERIVADAFRFFVPKEWEEQTDGSYIVQGERDDVYIYFVGARRETEVSSLPADLSVQDDSFPETFVEYLNKTELYEGAVLELSDSDTASWHFVNESGGGLAYRRLGLTPKDKETGKTVGSVTAFVYDWDADRFLMVLMDAYSISTINECGRIINSSIERID